MNRGMLYGVVVVLALVVLLPAGKGQAEEGGPPMPPARQIPGITATDMFPNGCVDCHINRPDINRDVRLSTVMKAWTKQVEQKYLAKAQAAAPAGVTLKGRHPALGDAFKNIPDSCLTCHTKTSNLAPPFARMIHTLHLTGGDQNPFMTMFQGECTLCHKLNQTTGAWSMPSASEK